MSERLRTGIDVLDQRLGGGVPPGTIAALSAPPASQAELLLAEFVAPRETLYLTLDRPKSAVADGLRRTAVETGDPVVRAVADEDRIDHAIELLDGLPERSTVVVDPHSAIEREGRTGFLAFMTRLRQRVADTDSLAVLHCLDGRDVSSLRDSTEHVADVIFDLTTDIGSATVENRLAVPKFRGGRALTDTLKLRLTDGVAVDTSRDIA
ncbi:RAD55 family ATPase [Halococcus sediminicola]|uniref:RAD55 family ATPase n=1 Tax=Halococcus sediminicola TaxID=1264579 RepID=UPI00067997F3|nr:transcriptional regulator [Halococcus sediminicola]